MPVQEGEMADAAAVLPETGDAAAAPATNPTTTTTIRLTYMQSVYRHLDPGVRCSIQRQAEQRLRDHNLDAYLAFGDGEEAAARVPPPTPASSHRDAVWVVRNLLEPEECASIRKAIDEAVAERGGWDRDRHRKYPTTDLPFSAVRPVQQRLRELVFERIILPMAPFYCGEPSLPEQLEVYDWFYVKYSAEPGEQRELRRHADASLFSFNILLSDPSSDFEGGGTFFESSGWTTRIPQGAALVHGGDVIHGGYPVTRGERYILVGFVEVMRGPAYAVAEATSAAADAFAKFGHAAWTRRTTGGKGLSPERIEETSDEVHLIGLPAAASAAEESRTPSHPVPCL
jgi:hypothetical protein